MAKVFRFHPGADLSHWQNSAPLNYVAINAIEDPNGLTAKKEITSIPSPFARIDLVRTAFKTISDSNNLDGNTIFHKMISDSFDIGQILFKSETFEDKINIISWDKKQDLDKLLNSSNQAHKTLGETLRLFLQQDADVYNFNELQRIYLINFKSGPNPINIIGGTSPSTLFFSTANKLDYVKLQEGQDIFFDNQFCPLYKRDPQYVKFIFGLSKSIPEFSKKFSFVNEYLQLTYTKLSQELRDEINNESLSWYTNLPALSIDGIGNLEINGNLFKTKKTAPTDIQTASDFVLQCSKEIEGLSPLVLPNDTFNENLKYTTANWDMNQKAPFFDSKKISDRKLPLVNDKYPYLTISDFLEPVILRTLLPINTEFFFDGNHQKQSNNSGKGFLLPIKPLFFNYFQLDDLKTKTIEGKPLFELKSLSNEGVEAILRLPIKNNKYIKFKRVYNNPISNSIIPISDESMNIGSIMENVFTVALYPFLKYPQNVNADYRVSIYEADYLPITEKNKYELHFYDDSNNLIENIPTSQKRFKEKELVNNKTYILTSNFNYIQLSNNFGKGILFPKFKECKGSEQFTFAIDFGTSNTHIEYSKNGGIPKAFDILQNEIQLATLNPINSKIERDKVNITYLDNILDFLNQDLIPECIGVDSEFSFPTRTVVYHHKNLDFRRPVFSLADISLPLTYEKASYSNEFIPKTNIKWANNDLENKEIIKNYFEKILLLIKSKVLLNNGNIESLKLVWFYPSSMANFKLNLLESLWSQSTTKIFNNSIVPLKVCESLAPFYFYKNKMGMPAVSKPVVSIDLGGGTTDIVIYENNKATLLTSFRFAGNSIFGDEYNRSYMINGFVQKYFNKYIEILDANSFGEISQTLYQIKERNNSNDIINSLFSLSSNKKLINNNNNISFLDNLKEDNELKIIFLLFFTSIQYHLAKMMKNKAKEIPEYISFSGTASKLIQILDPSKDQKLSSKIVNETFKFVFGISSEINIKIRLSDFPKEITSKGGVYITESENVNPNDIKEIYINEKIDSNNLKYSNINSENIELVIQEYKEFIDFFFNLNNIIPFLQNFGINPSSILQTKGFLLENALNALKTGLSQKETEIGEHFKNEIVEETLFFYPLIGSFGELAYNIYNQSKNTFQDA